MDHDLDGKCFRYTFIFRKDNITLLLQKRLQEYVSTYRKDIEEYNKSNVEYACNLFVYDDVLMLEEEETRIAPVQIFVFYGSDWVNFIDDLLAFQELFPSSKLPREKDYNYVLRDEGQKFDDFK